MTLGMLRDSAMRFEGIQKMLSEFLERSEMANKPLSPQQRARPRRQREQRRRTAIDLGLKVSFLVHFFRHLTSEAVKAEVRQHALLMLGRTDTSSPVPGPPDPQIIEQFNVEKIGGPSKRIGGLRLDLQGPVRSPWNVMASRCFRENFNKSQLYRQWPDKLVEEAFLRHIETIRTHYHQQTGRVSADAITERQVRSARRSRVKTVCSSHPVPSASR